MHAYSGEHGTFNGIRHSILWFSVKWHVYEFLTMWVSFVLKASFLNWVFLVFLLDLPLKLMKI